MKQKFEVNLDQNKDRSNKLIRVIFNADMRCGHIGLTEIAKRLKLDLSSMRVGDFIAFVNTRKTHLKLLTTNSTLAHLRMPEGSGQINMKLLSVIPKFFNGREIKYDDALKEIISKELR